MEVVADSALVTSGATTEVTTEVTTTDVNVATPKIAEVSTNTYVLSTGGVYSGNIHNGVPTWLTDAIIAQVTAGTLNISQLVNDLYVLVQSIELGVNQSIASVQNEVVSQSQYLTTVKSELQGDIAVAIEQYDTIVSPELAKAVKTDALGVIKGQVEAWALDVTDVYASNNLASATQVELLTSTLTDVNTGTVATATKLYEGYTTIGITPDGTGIASAGYLDTLSASVDDVNTGIAATATKLSEGYTTIGITPDGTGIASAGYLDTLSASVDDVSVALTTVERVAVEANEWSASSSKLITGPDGSITGWGFSDGSNEVSNFQIKATNFSISDGLTGHTPFSIVGSDVNFNGKVTFSSISDSGTYIPTISSVAAAQTEAADAKENAIAALTQLTDIASDSVLDPGEKTSVIAARDVIVAEKAGIDTQATAYGITTEKTTYDNAVGALTTYLATLTSPVLWSNLSGNTTIVGTTFRSKFNNVYTTRQALLDKIAIIAKSLVDTAQSTANSKPNVYYQTTAPSSVGRVLGDLWFDSDDKNHPYRWSGAAWASIRDLSIADTATASASANTAALNAMTAAQAAQATADGATTTYYQSAAPTGLNSSTDIGDMWFDTDDNQAYRWSGTTWLTIQDKSIVVALAAAQDAQTTADGKITSFYQTAQPTGANIGDLWFDIDNKNEAHYYNGMAWTTLRDGTIADAFYAAELAQTEAADAKENAIAALTQLTDIASDSVLDPGEKTLVRKEWEILVTEQVLIADQAAGLAVSAIDYRETLEYLGTYLNAGVAWLVSNPIVPTWLADVNLTTNTPINRSTFRGSFRMYYSERQLILNAISTKLKEIADSKVLPADVATAINTNITTIDGGKITTDAVFANRVFAENITATGTITGARINSGTITGARINGGTITSTDLVSSTIRVRDLQVVTDAGYPTVAIGTLFFTNTLTSYSEMVSYTNLYAYNATSVVSTYGTPIRAASSLIGTSISIYSPILLCIVTSHMGTKNAIYVAIYIGSTLLGTGRINGRGGEVAGITFSRTTSYSRNTEQYTDSMYVTSFTGAFTLSGEGPLKVVVTCRSATIQPANVTDNRALLSNL